MAFEMVPQTSKNPRRIMIITGDESIIKQFQNNSNVSFIKSSIIEPKDNEDELSDLIPPDTNQLSSQRRIKNCFLTCVVCGSSALGYNFDAITCESCKAFFRRNALKDPASLHCRRNSNCEVTLETRRRCSACRLKKCLNGGMKRERLQRAEEKAAKRRFIEANIVSTLQTKPHTNDQKRQSSISKTTKRTDPIELTSIQSHSHRKLLTKEDVDRVESIRNLYEQRIELAARDGLPWDPSAKSTTFLQVVNSRSVPAIRLLAFFRRIPEFNQLNVDDKVTLIKHNLLPLSILNGTLSYKKETDQIVESDSDVPWDSGLLQKAYGDEIFASIKRIFNSFVRIAQYDRRIIQMALIILILNKDFSANSDSNEPNLNDDMAVYSAQSFYTELLWKYMETSHGFEKSAYIFMELVVKFISWQTIEKQARISIRKALSSTDTNQLLPIMKSLLHMS
ncbi:unnamed protein product [Rotaria magnacalcarata]|uniref:Uncharacterized protein n=3 Tax=Rotaria magnacalcarata TaxID=392030 RepID=A0A816U2S1_9BILA|nr:unnamed protein product [Rotaria magnacalcarata]